MPEEFRKLQSASKTIQLAINGQPQPKELERATSDLHQVLKAQWDALDASPESRNTLEHEQILTVFKLWIAHDLIGNEDISIGTEARLHKLLLASEGAKPLYGDDVLNTCQWFSKYPLAPTEKTEDA
jgi:hypothetical protein